jgi:hypothetical protein
VDGLLDEDGRSILFDLERGVCLLLQVLVDRTSFVISGMVAITENTADCTQPVLTVHIWRNAVVNGISFSYAYSVDNLCIGQFLVCAWVVQI